MHIPNAVTAWYLLALAGLAVMFTRHLSTTAKRRRERKAEYYLRGIR